jgi:hypothetical protein
MGTKVISQINMNYDGTERYRGEIFNLGGLRNDDKLVRIGHVRPVTGDMELAPVRDDTGREFIDEGSRRAYRLIAPAKEVAIVQRRPGRPLGSKNKKPSAPRTSGIVITEGDE